MRLSALAVIAILPFAAPAAQASLADETDPLLGVAGPGSCMPGPCLPHASIYPSPDSLYPYGSRPFAPPSGIYYGDPVVGFSQLHTQGTGGTPTYGLFLISPRLGPGTSEVENASPLTYLSPRCYAFSGQLEKWRTAVRIVPTAHAAIYHFVFPEAPDARLVFNIARKIGNPLALATGSVAVDAKARTLSGGGTFTGNWNPAPYQAYFYAELDTVPKSCGTWSSGASSAPSLTVTNRAPLGAWCAFDTRGSRIIQLKIAVSLKSVEQARAWLQSEIPAWDINRAEAAAKSVWSRALSSVEIETPDPAARRYFYSQLAHAFVQPRDRTGDLPGWPASAPAWDDHYTLWDTWRTLFPLLDIIDPAAVAGCVNSFGWRLRLNGQCAACFIQGREYRVGQGGDEADCVIADAHAKRIPGIDWAAAWSVLAANAARRVPAYREIGYVPSDLKKHDYCSRLRSGSATLSFAYQDWLVSRVAAGLGHTNEAARLLARSANWTNVWDAAALDAESGYRGFVRGRLASGAFGVPGKRGAPACPTPPRARGANIDFYEGTCWEYSYAVPHDIPRLMALMGGREAFVKRLDYALENDLIDFGNEPSFLTVWLFDFAGRPDLASRWAARLRARFPKDGTPGDDDSGAMASLYVFLTAGFFPVAGQDLYALHGPAAAKITFRLPITGKRFTVIGLHASPDNPYIQSARLNDIPLETPFIHHADIVAGGTLEFVMGPKPSSWAKNP